MPKQINSFSEKNEKGFTLVEILVSLVLLLILVVAFVPLFTFVAQAITNNQAKDTATVLANKTIEDLRSLPFVVVDPVSGKVVTNPNVAQLGIKNYSACPGSVPAEQIIPIKGKDYTVKTEINWVEDIYKKVSVSIEYLSAFNNKNVVTEFFTLSSEEGELKTAIKGNILIKIADKNGNLNKISSVDVKITDTEGALVDSGFTSNGEKLFEEIPYGSYEVHAKIGNLAYSPDQINNDGWLVLETQVTNKDTNNAIFYLDNPAEFNLVLEDNSKNKVVGKGVLELVWTNGETTLEYAPMEFVPGDFTDEKLTAEIIKERLGITKFWPGGTYSVALRDVVDKKTLRVYKEYEHEQSFELSSNTPTTPTEITIKHFTKNNSYLKMHFDANANVDSTGENRVEKWKDKEGDFQAKSAMWHRPEIVAKELNGYPIIRFFSNNDYSNPTKFEIKKDGIGWGGPDVESTNNFTIFVVAKSATTHEVETQSNSGTSGTSGQRYLLGPSQKGNDAGCGLSLGTNGVSNYEHGNSYMPPTAVYSGGLDSLNSFNVITLKYHKPSESNPTADIYINGELKANGVPSARTTVYTPILIGGALGGENQEYGNFDGDLAIMLVYDTPLSDDFIQVISDFLKEKYAL